MIDSSFGVIVIRIVERPKTTFSTLVSILFLPMSCGVGSDENMTLYIIYKDKAKEAYLRMARVVATGCLKGKS
jgi:hypothetical protein